MSGKILVADGESILLEAFWRLPAFTEKNEAQAGLLSLLAKAQELTAPTHLAAVFDGEGELLRAEDAPAWRNPGRPFPAEYASEREKTIKDLQEREIPVLRRDHTEGCDLAGSIAGAAVRSSMECVILTADPFLFSLVRDGVCLLMPAVSEGKEELKLYTEREVTGETGVLPSLIPDVLALSGSREKNIPPLDASIGERRAAFLVKSFGSLENVFLRAGEVPEKAVRTALQNPENRAAATKRKELFTIKTEADSPIALDDFEVSSEAPESALTAAEEAGEESADLVWSIVRDRKEAEEILKRVQGSKEAAVFPVFDTPELELPEELLGLALSFRRETYYFPAAKAEEAPLPLGQMTLPFIDPDQDALSAAAKEAEEGTITGAFLKDILASLRKKAKDGKFTLDVFDVKTLYPFLGIGDHEFDQSGIQLGGIFDVLIGAYLCNPLKNDYQPQDVAKEYLAADLPSRKDIIGKGTFRQALAEDENAVAQYAARTAKVLYMTGPSVREKLRDEEMDSLYKKMELPLSYILYDMQRIGIRIVPEKLKEYGDQLVGRIRELEEEIHKEAGVDFNIASPKQLGEVLFEKMGIPGGKKTKSGWSTAADVLEKLSDDYPIVKNVLEYRALTKLKSTYADGLSAFIAKDSRIHTTFHQTITATGRISSTDPNLQNIPMRTDLGRAIRKVFIPRDGWCFTDSDYSQIELRILASMSGDPSLIEAFNENQDIHRTTASRVFHVPFDEVTPAQRRDAKAVNFGIVYGISSFGLSNNLSISRSQAAEYINEYFNMFPGIRRFLDSQVANAKERGYSVTMFGRRRPIPELKNSSFQRRQFGERVAMNAPIQGTGADIMKIAMIRVFEGLHRQGLQSRIILQIHDELLIETAPGEEEQVEKILKEGMMGAADLSVPLTVDCHRGSDWYEAK